MSEPRARLNKSQKSAVHVALGEAMRAVRREQGLSQEKLAARIGVDRSYYGAIERGEYKASIATIDRIASGLNMKISDLSLASADIAALARSGTCATRA